jgi:hypothetical protein
LSICLCISDFLQHFWGRKLEYTRPLFRFKGFQKNFVAIQAIEIFSIEATYGGHLVPSNELYNNRWISFHTLQSYRKASWKKIMCVWKLYHVLTSIQISCIFYGAIKNLLLVPMSFFHLCRIPRAMAFYFLSIPIHVCFKSSKTKMQTRKGSPKKIIFGSNIQPVRNKTTKPSHTHFSLILMIDILENIWLISFMILINFKLCFLTATKWKVVYIWKVFEYRIFSRFPHQLLHDN